MRPSFPLARSLGATRLTLVAFAVIVKSTVSTTSVGDRSRILIELFTINFLETIFSFQFRSIWGDLIKFSRSFSSSQIDLLNSANHSLLSDGPLLDSHPSAWDVRYLLIT